MTSINLVLVVAGARSFSCRAPTRRTTGVVSCVFDRT
jgi:hypothetical protein